MAIHLSVKYRKPFITVELSVPYGGRRKIFRAIVDGRMLLGLLKRAGVRVEAEIGFLGKLWKGIKKVGRAIGIDKVVGLAKKALPAVAAILPPPVNAVAGGAALALNTGSKLIKALGQKKRGNKRGAKRTIQQAAAQYKRGKKVLGRVKARAAARAGQRLYKIAVTAV